MYLNSQSSFYLPVTPDGIVVVGADHSIISMNEAAEKITGFIQNQVIGQPCTLLFNKPDNCNLVSDVFTDGKTLSNLRMSFTDVLGGSRNILASLIPIHNSDDGIIGVIVIFQDTLEIQKMAQELSATTRELLEERNKLAAIFNSSFEGIFTIDNDWTVTSFNKSAEKITGFRKDEALGKKCWDIFRSSKCRNGCHMENTIEKGKPSIGKELEIQRKDDSLIPIRVNSTILLNTERELIGGVETFIDLTEIRKLNEQLNTRFSFGNIFGQSKAMERVFHLAQSVARAESNVLITGESGTGKEMFARAIHQNSSRRNKPFIALNCSAFAETLIESELFGHEEGAFTGASKRKIGRFELAQNGTLFLDEIGDISPTLQTKLLRVIETKQFERVGGNQVIKLNARIIAATNKNLSDEIAGGRFREDLYFRINIINLHLPPLRQRTEDIPLLVQYFINRFNRRFLKEIDSVAPPVLNLFMHYSWPGNIRELENALEHAYILCQSGVITLDHLPERMIRPSLDAGRKENIIEISGEQEKSNIITALKKFDGNKKKAADELNINYTTLWRKMKKYKITVRNSEHFSILN